MSRKILAGAGLLIVSVFAQGNEDPVMSGPVPETIEKHSFTSPIDIVNEFTGMRTLDNWDTSGSAIVHRNFVRLTAEKQGQKGWISNRHLFSLPAWSLVMELRATGTNPYLYGDGLAIWFVETYEHVEGPVFGREDFWKGLGIFFDTFQNMDHQHHHKHPYIYAMVNDGKSHYVPDADKPDSTAQAMPGAHENSGCSFDFRYHEARHDVSVLNHTRVHVTYKDKVLKLRLQQTSLGTEGAWYDCFEMKDVEMPVNSGFFGISSATGDLVDNHDIINFEVRSLEGVADPIEDYDRWANGIKEREKAKLAEFDLRPAEGLQRDYSRVLRAQASEIKSLAYDINKLKQQMEYQVASIETGITVTRKSLDEKSDDLRAVTEKVKLTEEVAASTSATAETIADMKREVEEVKANSGRGFSFWFLFFLILVFGGVGYNRYRKLMKSHLP